MKDLIKGILILIATPVIIVLAVAAVIFFAWPIFCIGLVICCLVSMISTTSAFILFILMILFVAVMLIAKSL